MRLTAPGITIGALAVAAVGIGVAAVVRARDDRPPTPTTGPPADALRGGTTLAGMPGDTVSASRWDIDTREFEPVKLDAGARIYAWSDHDWGAVLPDHASDTAVWVNDAWHAVDSDKVTPPT